MQIDDLQFQIRQLNTQLSKAKKVEESLRLELENLRKLDQQR